MLLDKDKLRERLKNIKLVVTDIDGTLVNRDNEIGEKSKELIKMLREKGVSFTFATQRIHSSVAPLAKELNITMPLITLNGSLIQDADAKTVINRSVIKRKYIERALKFANKYFVRIAFCYKDHIIYTDENSVLKDFMSRLGTMYESVESYDDYLHDIYEIMMSGNDKEKIKYIRRKMNPPFRKYLKIDYFRSRAFSGVYNLEIRRAGNSKKTGLKKLLKFFNYKKSEIAVIGDWYNDRDLFKYGGTNIAVQNAVPELKFMAHYVTEKTNDEDGVAEFLQLLYDAL